MKKSRIIRYLLLTVLAVLGGIILSGCSKSFDLNKYLHYEITGYNGWGTVDWYFDYDQFETDMIKASGRDADSFSAWEGIAFVEDCFEFEWDKETGLSNGDTVNLTWDVDLERLQNRYKIKLKSKDIEEKVSGLTEVESFDAFADITCTLDGKEPHGTISVSNSKYPNVRYYVENSGDLSNGDVITIELGDLDPDYYFDQYGALPANISKEFTVAGLSSYVENTADITDELDQQMRQTMEKFVSDKYKSSDNFSVNDYNVEGYYVLSARPDSWSWNTNQVYMVLKINAHNSKNEDVNIFTYLKWTDVYVAGAYDSPKSFEYYEYPTMGIFGTGESFKSPAGSEYAGYATLDDFYNGKIAGENESWFIDTNIQ